MGKLNAGVACVQNLGIPCKWLPSPSAPSFRGNFGLFFCIMSNLASFSASISVGLFVDVAVVFLV